MSLRSETQRAELERSLTELWRAKLNVASVGPHDNFFELGGNSLLAADLLMDVYLTLDHEVDAWVLFQRPTVAELTAAILEAADPTPGD